MELKPGYKPTELGSLPEDWEEVKLGDFLDFKNGLNKAKGYFGHGTPIVNYMDVYNNSGLTANDILGRVTVTKQELDAYSANRGDVFFTRTSETAEEVGIASVLLEDIPDTVFSGFVLRARPKKHLLSDDFKKYCFSSEIVRNQIVSKSTYTTRALTNGRTLSSVVLPIPSNEREQKAIADALNDIDGLIESLERLIYKKRQIMQGALWELLSGKRRLPGFDDPWETKRLNDFGIFLRGAGVTKSQASSGDLRCVRYGEIYTRHNNFIREFWSWISREASLSATRLRNGDILFAGSGETREEIGKSVAFIDEVEAYAGGDIIILRLNDMADPLFFGYYLNAPTIAQQKANRGQGDAVVHIGMGALANIIVNIPQREEQIAIGKSLDTMDAEIFSYQTKLVKARQIKQGMMQELLTGRIRLAQPKSNVVKFCADEEAVLTPKKGHNSAINEAVIISVLAKKFGSENYPLGRKRYTKLSYLFHRHSEGRTEGYLEKAAGPYNPSTKYKGAEKIALSNRYVRSHARDNFSGFIAAEKIAEAEGYFTKWYGDDCVSWLEQFRYKKNDELELLATVDMAMVKLRETGKQVSVASVKQYLHDAPEWKPKLGRSIFADESIDMAIKWSQQLFES